MVCVNTVHMPAVYDVVLPESWHGNKFVDFVFQKKLIPLVESSTVSMYNGGFRTRPDAAAQTVRAAAKPTAQGQTLRPIAATRTRINLRNLEQNTDY
jgi:hypothetical protein